MERLFARLQALGSETASYLSGLFVDPSQRTYWMGLAAAGVVAFVLFAVRKSTRLRASQFWSASARVDYGLILVKPLVAAVFAVPLTLTAMGVAMAVLRLLRSEFGSAGAYADAASPLQIGLVYTVVLFVSWDLSRFALHWLMHRSDVLWQFHQVHHSAETMTPFTLYRVHPVESLLYRLRGIVVTGALTGLFAFLFGPRAVELELLGINAVGFVFSVVSGNLRHSHVWWSFGPRLERWFISPAQHQLHHAPQAEHNRANYGTWLAIWDRIAGTHRVAEAPPSAFGLDAPDCNHKPRSMLSALIDPCLAAFSTLFRRSPAATASTILLLGLTAREASAAPADEESDDADVDLSDFDESPEAGPPESGSAEPADAQEDAADDDFDVATPTVSIIGEFEELPRVVGSAYAVEEEELERTEHDDIHRVLRTVPGVYVRGEDGYGLRPNIGLRGADTNRSAKITLMEDGILFGPAPYSAPAAYYFPMTTRLTGIEVFKGPAAVRFGPNTIGGAINLKTREIPRELATGVDVAAGTYGYGKFHGYAGKSWKRFGFLAEGVRVRTNGFKDLDGGGDTGFRKNEFMLKGRVHGDPGARVYQQFDVKFGLSTEVSDETYLGITDADFEETPYRRYAASALDRMDFWRTQAQAGYFMATGIVEFQSTAYRHDFTRAWKKFNSFAGTLAPDPYTFYRDPEAGTNGIFLAILRGEADSLGTDENLLIGTNSRTFVSQGWQNVLRISPETKWVDQTIEVGARLHYDRIGRNHDEDEYAMLAGRPVLVQGTNITTTLNRGEALVGSFHVADEVTIADRFTISPGARVEVIRTEFTNFTPVPDGAEELPDETSDSLDTVFLPGVGVYVQATKWLGVLGGVHSGFSPKAPGQDDAVDPERSINYEAGFRVAQSGFRGEAIGFANDYSNLITNCTVSQGCDDTEVGTQFSGGAVLVAGAEALAGYRHEFKDGGWMDAVATYTYTWSRFGTTFTSPSPFLGEVSRGDAIPYLPVHVAAGQLAGGMRRWGAHAELQYNGEMRDVPGRGRPEPEVRIERFWTLDVGGNVFITRGAQLYLNLGNVTRNAYIVSRRPYGARPGRRFSVIGGFKYNFG
ncbi:MAG: TonB-dependent receptor [Myxococcota bacterium]